jgi:hypothetical protein
MDSTASRSKDGLSIGMNDYRASVKRMIQTEVGTMIDEEIKKAALQLIEEQRTVVREAIEEHKLVIRQVVEEERQVLRGRVEGISRAAIRLGSG